jgi:hypothetical protein
LIVAPPISENSAAISGFGKVLWDANPERCPWLISFALSGLQFGCAAENDSVLHSSCFTSAFTLTAPAVHEKFSECYFPAYRAKVAA